MSYDNVTLSHKVWPSGIVFDVNNPEHIVIKVGDRCNCWRRVDFDIQYKHELRINLKFKELDWGHRWFNRRQFNRQYPNMSTFETNPEVIEVDNNIDDNPGDVELICVDNNNSDNDKDNLVFNSILDKHNSKVTYSDVLEMATDLCRTVSANQKLCKSTYGTLFEWITKLREGHDFEISFKNKGLPKTGETAKKTIP